jgi:RES domain
MMRYNKYFLQHILWLDDGFCQYYVQNHSWGLQEILDVEAVIFDWPADAEDWLIQCADYDQNTTLKRLRGYLANSGSRPYPLHRMNDRKILRAAAEELTRTMSTVVIEPNFGLAVRLDPISVAPELPLTAEPEPDLTHLLSELKAHLDGLVADQQEKKERYQAQLAKMSARQKALFYSQKDAAAVYDNTFGALWHAVKSFPGFYAGYLKTLWKIAQLPGQMAALTGRAIATGDYNPLKAEIDKIVAPVAKTYEEAIRCKSMLTILLSDRQTYDLLYDFAGRYYEATHPVELSQMAASAVADIVVAVILAILAEGVGAAAYAASKSGRLAKVAELLEKIAGILRRTGPRARLMEKGEEAAKLARVEKRTTKAARKLKHAQDEVQAAERAQKLEKEVHKGYHAAEEAVGPKTTNGYQARTSPEITQSVLDKIDPKRFSPDTRFGKAFYVAEKGDVAVAEVASHGATPTHVIRYKIDLSKAKVLDLTDPAVVKKWGSPAGNSYAKTQAIAKKAQEAGFDAIKFPSQRASGNNIAIFDKFDEILSPQMVTSVK